MFAVQHSIVLAGLALAVTLATPGAKSRRYCDETHSIKGGRVRRIMGGSDALPKEFPHMVSLGYAEGNGIKWWCGGSLINSKFILTAATCIDINNRDLPKYVKLGGVNLKSSEVNITEIARVFAHPAYTPLRVYDNIGLIELKNPIEFSDFIKPACLNVEKSPGYYRSFVATGWGVTAYNGKPSDKLKKVTLNEVSTKVCRKYYQNIRKVNRGILDDSQICAVGLNKDTCDGDYGSPIQILNPKYNFAYDIYGITSFGKACGMNYPGVYTRVSYYIDWIESIAF